MKVDPTKGEGASRKEPQGPPQGKPPGKDFKKSMDKVHGQRQPPEGKKEPPKKKPPTPFDLKKAKTQTQKQKAQAQQLAQEEAAVAAMGQQGQQKEGSVSLSADVQASGYGSAVDKIIQVFQNNPIFSSQIGQLQVNAKGAETHISILLQNGVQVDINLTGGQDLNIQIQGLTDAAQTALDNAAHQQMLREKLAEQGFSVHQITTFRGEGQAAMGMGLPPPPLVPPSAPTAGQQPFYGREGGEGEGRGGGRDEPEEEEQ